MSDGDWHDFCVCICAYLRRVCARENVGSVQFAQSRQPAKDHATRIPAHDTREVLAGWVGVGRGLLSSARTRLSKLDVERRAI